MTNPTEALDAVEQALRIYSDPYNQLNEDGEELRVPDFYAEMDFERFATEALTHITTLRQQVADLVAYAKACYPLAQGPDWEEQHPIIKQFAPAADGGQGA